jgi:N-acetylglucosamine-6-phosphate deacetylase
MCDIHARLGATGILPTLITDSPEATARVIAAGIEAVRRQTPGFLGLHLEGPHLDPRRKGAHDPALIRPMTEDDLVRLLEAAARLPSLMLTVAPESVTPDQIGRLAAAGVIVSLGHSDCTAAEAKAAMAAGAACVTHLFNAMSQLGNREPGLVGAALTGPVHAGLIADGIHVAPETIRIAMAASDRIFLVSDAMAAAGSSLAEFTLNGRRILRRDGSLRLEDGTLAGADLTLPQAVAVMIGLGTPVETALAMATSRPAACLRRGDQLGSLQPGRTADMVHLGADGMLKAVWRAGQRIA